MAERIGGVAYLKVDGTQYAMAGSFTYNLGYPKREPKIGPDGVQGFTEMPQAARIEGEVSDTGGLSHKTLLSLTDATVTLELANGKTVVVRNGFFSADGDGTTEQGNFQFAMHGLSGDIS